MVGGHSVEVEVEVEEECSVAVPARRTQTELPTRSCALCRVTPRSQRTQTSRREGRRPKPRLVGGARYSSTPTGRPSTI